jgi:hypothetical protein
MLAVALAVLFLVPCAGTGAYVSKWLVDLRTAPVDYEGRTLLQKHVNDYGVNQIVSIISHPSQWWFEVYAVFFDKSIDDISDAYVPTRSGNRHYVFIGYLSMVMLMLTLVPLFKKHCLPWHEAMIQGNNYEGEVGVTVTVRHYLHPLVWWARQGVERSIPGRLLLYRTFKQLRLPQFVLAEGGWNYAAWKPYWQLDGPVYFTYSPPRYWTIKDAFNTMLQEETYAASYYGRPEPCMDDFRELVRIYKHEYVQGPYVSLAKRRSFNAVAIALASRTMKCDRSRM